MTEEKLPVNTVLDLLRVSWKLVPPTPYYNVAATQIDKRGGRSTGINVAS